MNKYKTFENAQQVEGINTKKLKKPKKKKNSKKCIICKINYASYTSLYLHNQKFHKKDENKVNQKREENEFYQEMVNRIFDVNLSFATTPPPNYLPNPEDDPEFYRR